MNAVANIAKPSAVDAFVGEVLPPDRRQSLFSGMPSHIKPAVFERNLVNAVMANTNLMKYDPRLVYREVSKAAGLGLLLDPQLGEAYIIEAYNYKTRSVEPLLRVGYRGLVKLARQSGEIDQVYAHEVYSLDHLECDLGVEKRLIHKPILFSDRGAIVGYYSVVKYKGGDYDFEPMSVDEVHTIRDRSDAWKAFKDGKIKSTPWSTDDVEMSKKTVIRRLVKRVPQSPELADALRLEDQAEGVIESAVVRAITAPRLPPAPPAARQVAYVETHQQDDGVGHAPETGEVQQDEPARDEPQPEAKPARRAAPKPAETKAEPVKVTSGKQQDQQQEATGDAYDPAPILAEIQKHLDGCEDDDMLEAVRVKSIMPLYDKLTVEDQATAKAAYVATRDRIAEAAEAAERAANETAAAEAGDPVWPDERSHPDDDTFPGDRPSTKQAATEKAPADMNDAELEAYIRDWITASTDAVVMKKRWFAEAELRDNLDPKVAGELRALWKRRSDELGKA